MTDIKLQVFQMSENITALDDDAALERLLTDLEANNDGQRRIVRRVLDAPISPEEPTFLAEIPSESHGPFVDKMGQLVHIDVITAATLIGIQFTGQSAPFIYFSSDNPPTGSTSSLPVSVDGSVWIIASKLLATASPGFVGLRAGKGTISFSTAVPVNVNPIIVPTSVNVTATLTLHPEAIQPPGVPGSIVNTPLNVEFSFSLTTGLLSSANDGSLEAFQYTVNLKFKQGQPRVHNLFSQLCFPFTPDKATFAVVSSSSQLVKFSGAPSILTGAWALQISNVPPTQLGQVSGAGGMLVDLSEGLQMLPLDRTVPIDCGKCTIFVQPNSLTVLGASAVPPNRLHTTNLWAQSTLSFRTVVPSVFGYASRSTSTESWTISSNLVVMLSQPRTIDDTGFRASGKGAVLLSKSGSNAVQFRATIPLSGNQTRTSYAIKNALFNLVGPSSVTVSGTLAKGNLVNGTVLLPFTLGFAIPFLPDPYTYSSTIDPPTAPGSTPIVMTLTWPATPPDPLIPVAIDINLNTTPAQSAVVFPHGGTETDIASSTLRPVGSTLVDLSTNLSQFGVAYLPGDLPNQKLSVKNLYLQASATAINVVALPAVQWEPLITPGPDPLNFPNRLGFLNGGPMTQFITNNVTLTPLAPRQAIDGLLTAFHSGPSPQVNVHFTLPFGLEAYATINRSDNSTLPTTDLNQVQPRFTSQNWTGGDQLSITVKPPLQPLPGPQRSPVFPGWMRTVPDVTVPTGNKALDPLDPDGTFGPGQKSPGVPVSRVDISGFGESVFSDWHDPSTVPNTISKVEFGVIVGRTFREVVQTFSVLLPYGVFVVRTIIIERQNTGIVTRTDTGWRAVADGDYKVLLPAVVTHPGVVSGATKVKNIRDTGTSFAGPAGTQFGAVVFDCFITMENVVTGQGPDGVPAVNQVGYILTAPPQQALQPDAYAALLAAKGSLGGRIDCTINVGNSGLLFRVTHVGVGSTVGTTGTAPTFAMTAWGVPVLPGGGQWSVAQVNSSLIPEPVDQDMGVPLVRHSPVDTSGPISTPYRFAAPVDLESTATPAVEYGIIHSTGTQRLLFLRPKIEVSSFALSSVIPPILADPAVLGTSTGIFPRIDICIPFDGSQYTLLIQSGNNLTLKPSASFATKKVGRIIRDSTTLRSIAWTDDKSVVNLSIDTAAAIPWSLNITNLGSAFESGSLGEVMRVAYTLTADAETPAQLVDAQVVWGPSMDAAAKALTLFNGFGAVTPLIVSMTNQWSCKFSMQMDLNRLLNKLPAVGDIIKQFVKQLNFGVSSLTSPTATSIQMDYDAAIMIPIGTGSVVGYGKVRVLMKTDLKTGDSQPATSVVEVEVGAGWGLSFSVAGFDAYAFGVLALVIITGANTFGIGAAIILRGHVDLHIISITLTSELKGFQVSQTCGVNNKNKSVWLVAQATISLNVSIFLVINVGFSVQYQWIKFQDNGTCPLPELPI